MVDDEYWEFLGWMPFQLGQVTSPCLKDAPLGHDQHVFFLKVFPVSDMKSSASIIYHQKLFQAR